jgi:hypothetical protein
MGMDTLRRERARVALAQALFGARHLWTSEESWI